LGIPGEIPGLVRLPDVIGAEATRDSNEETERQHKDNVPALLLVDLQVEDSEYWEDGEKEFRSGVDDGYRDHEGTLVYALGIAVWREGPVRINRSEMSEQDCLQCFDRQ